MKVYVRRSWEIEHSSRRVPRFSATHLFEEGRVTALCGLQLPRRERDSALVSGAGTPLCKTCAARLAKES